MLEAGKMGKNEDLSTFDLFQSVMTRQWCPAINKCSQEGTSDGDTGSHGSLMHVENEGWPVSSDPTDELLATMWILL